MDEEESLECPVCLERYDKAARTPKMMPCLHTICVSCIHDVISINESHVTAEGQSSESKEPNVPSGKRLVCPLCRENISTDRLQTNRYILAHLRDLSRLHSQNHASLEGARENKSVYQHSQNIMTSTVYPGFQEAQRVPSDKPNLIGLSKRRLSRKQGRAPSPPSYPVLYGTHDLHKDPSYNHSASGLQAVSGLQFQLQSQPSVFNSQYTTRICIREGKRTRKLRMAATSSTNFQPPAHNTPTTPIAGHPLIYPKLPPATTLHQQSPSQQKGLMKIVGQGTTTISEEDFTTTSDSRYHIPYETSTESSSNPNPSAPTDMNDMWCRTCEEPGKTECIGHDLIAILKEDEANWIQTELRGQDKLADLERNIDLSAAMGKASISSPPKSHGFVRTSAHNRRAPSEVLDMGRWSYAEIRDTVNTSCQPEVVMECYRELDRRHKEYHRTLKKKKLLRLFLKSNS